MQIVPTKTNIFNKPETLIYLNQLTHFKLPGRFHRRVNYNCPFFREDKKRRNKTGMHILHQLNN